MGHGAVTPLDLAIRNATYRLFVELGRAPTTDDVAAATGQGTAEVSLAWRRLHDGHGLVLDQAGNLRMANPFSAVETPFVVESAGKTWFANCGWDAFGIGAALHVDSITHTTCPDCGDPIDISIVDGRPTEAGPVWHCLVPAREWWSDIGFT
jgi:Alkylmercury lyase